MQRVSGDTGAISSSSDVEGGMTIAGGNGITTSVTGSTLTVANDGVVASGVTLSENANLTLPI